MKTIHMRLTFKWYDLIDCGYKTHEYRLVDKWKARLNGVKRGDFIVFHRGHTDRQIRCEITDIRITPGWLLPKEEYEFFGGRNEPLFYNIEFKKIAKRMIF